MKLVVVSGRSGSGKSTALQALEDIGFYCIDNLPARLLPDLVEQMSANADHPAQVAVSIDARNLRSNLLQFPQIYQQLCTAGQAALELLFLDAGEATLLKRFSATRRKHPLTDNRQGLQEAIQLEKELLEPIANLADIRIDTTRLTLYQLRDTIKLRIAQRKEQQMSIQFESFGFKHGVPLDVDLVFDVRVLPNPYWIPELRGFTGREAPVVEFLDNQPEVAEMIADIRGYLQKWLPSYAANNRSYVTIGIGCTGGQHRSVYIAERLTSHFADRMDNVHVRHRELGSVSDSSGSTE
ncbi:RNase adapter RapZ [Marinobacterium arenosum]|uniref:RNase adapter RapZ n=1 Tax=Marinobacterium arenosum TaxID=2862496 RepID=UPI001C962CFF|nr:RNase adapter RapZ [Marinobacterium arenosum]MBY4676757.1 RNase adapter RapZ [Marinobacterium arenosum]